MSIEILDVNASRGKFKALMKGVKVTPTMLIGKHKIKGGSTPEQLRNKLKDARERIKTS